MWVGCKGISFHITVLVHTGPLSFGRQSLSAFRLRNLFMARCVLEHLPLCTYFVFPPQQAPLARTWPPRALTYTYSSVAAFAGGSSIFSCKIVMYVHFILLLWANFCTKVSCTSMLLSSISYSRYCSTASTTLHITNGSQRRIASTCPSESDNASKQTELKSEYIVEHLYSTLRSQNEEMSNCIFRKPIQLHTHR